MRFISYRHYDNNNKIKNIMYANSIEIDYNGRIYVFSSFSRSILPEISVIIIKDITCLRSLKLKTFILCIHVLSHII